MNKLKNYLVNEGLYLYSALFMDDLKAGECS